MAFKPNELKELTAIVAALCETFGRSPTEATYLGYKMGLEDLPLSQIKHAAARAMRESEFMPTVAKIRELAGVLNADGRAVLAWTDFSRTASSCGAYSSVDFQDSVINATVRALGGWEYVCELGGDEFDKWLRQRFLQTYKAIESAPLSSEAAAPLFGIHGRNNAGFSPETLRMFRVDDTPIPIECATHRPAVAAIESKQQRPVLQLKQVPGGAQ